MTSPHSLYDRWETVHDPVNDRTVTINVDTLRVSAFAIISPVNTDVFFSSLLLWWQILNNKACICEFCDQIIEENDSHCFNCKAARSVKNAPLYRPLGGL
jgi:hypothetical protein